MVRKAKQETPVPGLEILKQVPVEGNPALLVRNVRAGGAISMRSGGRGDQVDPDVTLARRCEKVVPASWAKTSDDLRRYISLGWIEAKWVDEGYQIQRLVTPDDAPGDLLSGLNSQERIFAYDSIALQPDLALAIARVNTIVHQEEPSEGMVDERYMTQKFARILNLAEWLEENIDARPKVLSAIKAAKAAIREM